MIRLVVDPLTRVEGHGRVELQLRDGKLVDVTVRLLEAPRLFEALVVGRRCDEVPDLISRICAICSATHKVTALQAIENAMAVKIPPLAAAYRELLLLGGHIQSHALHLFCLILPDLYGTPDIIELLRQKVPLAQAGLDLKAFGNRIQKIAGGRVIHPVNPVFGGIAYQPGHDELEKLAKELLCWQRDWPDFSARLLQLDNYPEASPVIGTAVATGLQDEFALTGDCLWYGNDNVIAASDYAQLFAERPRPDTHAKDATGKAGPFLTGALARDRLATGRNISRNALADHHGIHGNNLAQVKEVGWALHRVGQLLETLLRASRSEPLRTDLAQMQGGIGTAAMEAPRGLLLHHYVIDEWGTIVAADIVTPTALNQRVIAAQIMADLTDEKDHARLREVAERIVRAYDPCISCAVHLVTVENPSSLSDYQ